MNLIKRLRNYMPDGPDGSVHTEAADRIAELERMLNESPEAMTVRFMVEKNRNDVLEADYGLLLARNNVLRARLDAVETAYKDIRWVSSDKDNMEFTATITCWQHDRIKALEQKQESNND